MAMSIDPLEEEWQKGKLKDLERDLEDFLRSHADEIRSAALKPEAPPDQTLIDHCVRHLIRRRGTVNPKRDILDQAREISNEIWWEGERICGPVPQNRQEEIARNWAHTHAAKWREWRLREILYAWEKNIPRFIKLILDRRDSSSTRRHKRAD
jgi:hypothetical protein